MKQFISCDWGSSTLRLRLVEVASMSILAETTSHDGVLKISNETNSNDRFEAYTNVLNAQIGLLTEQISDPIPVELVIISGMASSSFGIQEVPYSKAPIFLDGSNLNIKQVYLDIPFDVLLISGVCTGNDVMRGEETIAIGAAQLAGTQDGLIIQPGTHSKHIFIRNGELIDFKTYMTGEFFDVLTTKSILSKSIENSGEFNERSFKEGVLESENNNLLNTLFTIRARHLLEQTNQFENFDYVSGLLIGSELRSIKSSLPIYLVSTSAMHVRYRLALTTLGLKLAGYLPVTDCLVAGQLQITRQNRYLNS